MNGQVVIKRDGAVGIITLNRPEAINALSQEMIDAILAALEAWAVDVAVGAVLMKGNGERGFCAGGDVRATRQLLLDGKSDEVLHFFAQEYRLNGMIATFPKPIIALTHGITMGGGIGLAGHARIRIAARGAKYAMPEAAIGLFCDVGANALLARAAPHRALSFAMSGLAVGPADAIALNLADFVVERDDLGAVGAALIAVVNDGGDLAALRDAAGRHASKAGIAEFVNMTDGLAGCFAGQDAGQIVSEITSTAKDEAEIRLADTLAKRCPTSLEVILQSYFASSTDPDVGAVLGRDFRLAAYMVVRSDFAEGVRAVLIDKDNTPVWMPAAAGGVDRQAIASVLSRS